MRAIFILVRLGDFNSSAESRQATHLTNEIAVCRAVSRRKLRPSWFRGADADSGSGHGKNAPRTSGRGLSSQRDAEKRQGVSDEAGEETYPFIDPDNSCCDGGDDGGDVAAARIGGSPAEQRDDGGGDGDDDHIPVQAGHSLLSYPPSAHHRPLKAQARFAPVSEDPDNSRRVPVWFLVPGWHWHCSRSSELRRPLKH
jgi:hypothetical protein